MSREKRILGAIGAIGVACMAGATALTGVDVASGVGNEVKFFALGLGALGTSLSAGVAYYKASLTE